MNSFNRLELAGDERWFLVRTAPKSERRAQFHLNAQGFRAYAPWILKTVRHARQFRSVHAPLFPGYLFVILDLGRDRRSCVRSTVGVASVICRDNRPVPVPAAIVEGLIAQTDVTNVTRLDRGLALGAPVRILSGPFAQLVGTLERLDEARGGCGSYWTLWGQRCRSRCSALRWRQRFFGLPTSRFIPVGRGGPKRGTRDTDGQKKRMGVDALRVPGRVRVKGFFTRMAVACFETEPRW